MAGSGEVETGAVLTERPLSVLTPYINTGPSVPSNKPNQPSGRTLLNSSPHGRQSASLLLFMFICLLKFELVLSSPCCLN